MEAYKEKREEKYKLKRILKDLDYGNAVESWHSLEKSGLVPLDAFIRCAEDNGVALRDRDIAYLRKVRESRGKVNYEDIVRELTLVVDKEQ